MKKKLFLSFFTAVVCISLSSYEMLDEDAGDGANKNPEKIDCTEKGKVVAYGTKCTSGGSSCGRNDCP